MYYVRAVSQGYPRTAKSKKKGRGDKNTQVLHINKKLEREMKTNEDAQNELRESTEHSNEIAAEVKKLLKAHKRTLKEQLERRSSGDRTDCRGWR